MFVKGSSMDDNSTKTRFEEDDEIELELCLSLGGSFRKTEKYALIENHTEDKRDKQSVDGGIPNCFDADLSGACVDSLSKREIHALRRQEARKKREAKQQQRKGDSGRARNGELLNGGIFNCSSAGEQGCKRIKTECNGFLNGETNGGNLNLSVDQNGNQNVCSGPSPVSRVHYRYPVSNRSAFGNTCGNMTSFLAGGNDGKRLDRPVAAGGSFRPQREEHQPTMDNNVGNGYGSGQVEENRKPVSNGSPVCSSSGVSDPNSSSPQGGSSCDSGMNSSRTRSDLQPPVNNTTTSPEETEQSTDRSNATVPESRETSNLSRQNSIAKENGKPPKPQQSGNGGNSSSSFLPFAQMPCVTTTGNGPEGKTVNGFLYRYSKSEICIICVCHGRSFSPAEFVRHAGGTEVSHPLRHITVIPSAI